MANVLNRVTNEYRQSVHTPDFPDGPTGWMLDPDVSAVYPAVPTKYWVVPAHPGTDAITEMDAAAKAVVDAAEAAALVTFNRAEAVAEPDDVDGFAGWRTRELIELFNKRDNYLVNRIEEIQTALTNIRDQVLGTQARQNIPPGFPMATSTRPRSEAIQDYKDDINAGGADS